MSYANDMPALSRSDVELTSALRFSVMRLARRLRAQRAADEGLSLSQLATLATMDRHGPLTPRELAQHEKVQPPSMTRILAGLEERGLIDRTAHPSDGRQQLVTITKQAKALLRENRRRRDVWLAMRLRELSAEDRDILRAAAPVLERLGQL
jgi:DNA-binding MarR family transcriptional regulator